MALSLSSPAFDDGAAIPRRYGRREDDVSPPLRVEGIPDGAETLALVVDDPDALEPAGRVWDHWVAWNIDPETDELPEGFDPGTAGGREGTNDFGETGYGGPAPPDREHTYRFRVYALDTELDIEAGADTAALVSAMQGHVIDEAEHRGTYAP